MKQRFSLGAKVSYRDCECQIKKCHLVADRKKAEGDHRT